jgi:hypothetical protein
VPGAREIAQGQLRSGVSPARGKRQTHDNQQDKSLHHAYI